MTSGLDSAARYVAARTTPKLMATGKLELQRADITLNLRDGRISYGRADEALASMKARNDKVNRWRFPALLLRIVTSVLAMAILIYSLAYGWNRFVAPALETKPIGFGLALGIFLVARLVATKQHDLEQRTKNKAEVARRNSLPWFELFKERMDIHTTRILGGLLLLGLMWFIAEYSL